ncbi:MAG: hypothetical protein PHS32_16375 [Rhodoferax sp.]|uniref:hypothetical protein n=1 Tax=Rhodoferax sp. TaxID=50421 RepID=UPI002601CED9|nr:hypothetical protein [Rhodoferax sp.]MDD5335309.1 hypothetical protein [Rhodoferax sp.]
MKIKRLTSGLVVAAGVALATLGMAGTAQAQNVFWSLGLSSPGVQLGVSSAPPMMVVQPSYQPVYETVYESRPVYVAPRPVVYARPATMYVAPPVYLQADWRYPGYRRGWQRQERHEYQGRDGERGGHGGHDRRD